MSDTPGTLIARLAALAPRWPAKWTNAYLAEIVDRGNKRIAVLNDRISGITAGRVMPDREQVTIGGARRFDLAILFLDICGFSARGNWSEEQQNQVLVVMNLFMAEMLNIIRDFGGVYEKNTGDGLMAYFGEGASTAAERVRPAVEAAVVMHYANDNLLTPWFRSCGIDPIRFRVGIDVGPVTLARVGLRGDESSIVAIGTVANTACKLMKLIPAGGVCIGRDVYEVLPQNWSTTCQRCSESTGFVYVATQQPYEAWVLNHRLVAPFL